MNIKNTGSKRKRRYQPRGQDIFRTDRVICAEPLPNQDLYMVLQDQSGRSLPIVVKLEALYQFLEKYTEGVNRCVDVRKHLMDSSLRLRHEDVS
jgi:hypothetical protein